MRTALNCLIILVIFSGCDSIGKVKSENPVLGPPPPRMPLGKKADSHSKALASTNEIKLVHNEVSNDSFRGNDVIAMVNGEPVFASEITDLLSGQMKMYDQKVASGELSPEQFTQARKQLCKNFLPRVIKQHVLLSEMKKNLTEEQQEELNTQLKEGFKNHIEGLKKRNNVQTRYELEKILAKQNIELVDMEYLIMNEELAKFYEGSKAREKTSQQITRADLLAEYKARKKDYIVEGTVKWQQISINYDQPGGKEEALDIMKDIIEKLGTGTSFEELAKEYSDGPTAGNGGNWGWIKPDSLSETVLVDSLNTLPRGKISKVLEGKQGYHLIRILKRKRTRTISFEEVQGKIKKDLENAQRKEAFEKVYKELRAQADVQTVFDAESGQEETMIQKKQRPPIFK